MYGKDATSSGPPPYVGGYMFMLEKGVGIDDHTA